MLVEIHLSDEERKELRDLTGIEEAAAALRFAVLDYMRRARNVPREAAFCSSESTEASDEAIRAAIEQARAMTLEVYGNVGEIRDTCDIEDETWRIIVVHVEDSGDTEATVARFRRWHERLSELPEATRGMFRLSLDINPGELQNV